MQKMVSMKTHTCTCKDSRCTLHDLYFGQDSGDSCRHGCWPVQLDESMELGHRRWYSRALRNTTFSLLSWWQRWGFTVSNGVRWLTLAQAKLSCPVVLFAVAPTCNSITESRTKFSPDI